MRIYTIGFTQKRAEAFFNLLHVNDIRRLVDIRLKPGGQLSAFAKQEDLPYFLNRLADGCQYVHLPELAPTKEILEEYRKDGDWARYTLRFIRLMEERQVPGILARSDFEQSTSCLLCSEPTPQKCHRKLVAERLASHWPDVSIVHL